jgi:superfamily II DNA or RNA helicase
MSAETVGTIILRRSDRYPYYFIIGKIDSDVLRTLRNELSFYVNGYERTNTYKSGDWDGREVLLYRHKNGDFFFPTGLIDRVMNVLSAYGVKFLIEDATEIPHETIGLKRLSKITLHEYQRMAVESIFMNGGGVVALPTGAGKTVIALQTIYAYDLPALILVNTKELLEQWRKNIVDFFGYEPGLVGDGKREFKQITVAMVQTMYNIVCEEGTDIDYPVLICDECHRVGADTIYKVAMNCYAAIRIGLSATVHRTDGADLKIWAALGEVGANITPEMLIDQGYLARPNFHFEKVPSTRLPKSCKWHEAYTSLIVCNEVRNERIIYWAKDLVSKGYRTFVSVNRVDHGEMLAERIPGAVFLSGKDKSKDRQEMLARFREGKLMCIVSTLLSEGVDLPEMEAIILAGGGKSSILAIQRVGRALRTTPDKNAAYIIDFIDTGKFVANHSQLRMETFKEYYGKYCVLPNERIKAGGTKYDKRRRKRKEAQAATVGTTSG